MSFPSIQTAFSAGEISPNLWGHVDLAKFHVGASTLRNAFVNYRGGAYSRAGTAYCNVSKQAYGNGPPRLIRFRFNINQGFCLEFGEGYMRVFADGAAVTEPPLAVTGATQANPTRITVPAHGYANNDWVALSGLGGMTELNGEIFIIQNVTTNTFTLTDVFGVAFNSTTFPAYTGGGTSARIYTLATPYLVSELPLLKYTQSTDTVSLVHPNHQPMDLVRITDSEWTLTPAVTASSIAAPATASAYPTVGPSQSTSPVTLPAAYAYVVTAVDAATGEESVASLVANSTTGVDISATGGSNIITWATVPGAATYNVYKAPTSYNTDPGNTTSAYPVPAGALFGFMATSYGNQAVDTNITADDAKVPPLHLNPFEPGQLLFVNVVSPGSGLTTVTPVITTSTGSGAVLVPVIVSGAMVAVIVQNPGQGYAPTDSISFGAGAVAGGNITFSAVPHNGDTIRLNGQVWTFVTGSPGANQTRIGTSLSLTMAQLATDLGNSTDAGLIVATYTANATQLLITYNTPGTAGNSYTLAASVATPSGTTLTGGGTGTAPTATLDVGPQTGTYPGVVAYFQQRRVYAATLNQPDTYFMSRPGAFLNFDSSVPVQDDDAITGTPWAVDVDGIQFMIPMPGGLVVLTALGAWQVTGQGGSAISPQPITPSSQQAQPQAFNGCNDICEPFVEGYDIIYVQAKGSIVRDLAYSYWANIYTGSDLTELSGQLFTGYTLSQVAWTEEPYKIAWYVRSDGALLSLTYLKEQEVYGWARHDTYGSFVSVCSVVEPPVDALYVVASRPTAANDGTRTYFIERMNNRIWGSVEDAFCVDCGLTLAQPEPDAILYAGSVSGPVAFVASAAVFSAGNVGSVIRAAGGIATITSYTNAQNVIATWVLPPAQTIPNGATATMVAQQPGQWTMTQPVTTVGGLRALSGQTVTGLADGVPIPPQVVTMAGTITLAAPASAVTVGLPFQVQVQSVYLDTASQPTEQGRRKSITAATIRVDSSLGFKVGSNETDGSTVSPAILAPAWNHLKVAASPGRTYTSPGGSLVTSLATGDIRVNLDPNWAKPGQVAVQQDLPLPVNVTAFLPETLDGDLPEMSYQQKPPSDPRAPKRGPGMWMLRA
jgi:hypothetical protein